jgi:phosphonate transport system permease protein
MATSVPVLSNARLETLERAYAEAQRSKQLRTGLGTIVFLVCVAAAVMVAEVRLDTLWINLGRFTSYIGRIFLLDNGQPVWTNVYGNTDSWYWGLWKWLRLIGETLVIAYLGTIIGLIGGFALCFLAAANLVQNTITLFVVRRFLEFCRTVPEIVFALIFVVAFGLGPLPGILALAIHTIGALGKQFYEVAENIDMKPFEGLTSTGASWTESVRFAVVPQVISNFASYALLRFEINVRGAAIMGFVGAGGIGQDLLEAIRKFYYSDVSAMLVLIIATVMVIDLLTDQLRQRLLGSERT